MKWVINHFPRDDDFVDPDYNYVSAPPVWIDKTRHAHLAKRSTARTLMVAVLTYPGRP
jgi:hypothetical protein